MSRFLILLFLAMVSPLSAAEITSNGTGGGSWSDPASWRGGRIPGPSDDVFIRKFDVISFDRNESEVVSCQKLQIDPKGSFQFKTGVGPLVCTVADAIECYGAIKIDGTRGPRDLFEVRLIGAMPHQRQIKLAKGSALLLYGRTGTPSEKNNVILRAVIPGDDKKPQPALIECDGQVAIDWQRARLDNIFLKAHKLDNTGAKPGERINLIDNFFENLAHVQCQGCDTPIVRGNRFHNPGILIDAPAINCLYCPLAEIKNNQIQGKYQRGIAINYQTDSSVIGNSIEGCSIGIQGGYSIPNTMIRQNTLKHCGEGLNLEGGTGVVEEVAIEGCTKAIQVANSRFHLNQVVVRDPDPKGQVLTFGGGSLTLLNCNLKPADIHLAIAPAFKQAPIAVQCQTYVIVKAEKAPKGSLIDLRTNDPKLPADVADPNVRNTPAPIVDGWTPLPKTLSALVVQTWAMDAKGQVIAAPEYTVRLLGPAGKEGDDRPVLKTQAYRPSEFSFRAIPNEAVPTLEVTLP